MKLTSLLAALTAMVASMTAHAQAVRLTLDDGSTVQGKIAVESLPIHTKYGQLSVPLTDIRSIKFGLHNSAVDAKTIAGAVKMLDSSAYPERGRAMKELLALGRRSVPSLWLAAKSTDPNTVAVAKRLLEQIVEADPSAAIVVTHDRIETAGWPIIGQIKLEELKIHSAKLGVLTVKLADIESLSVFGSTSGKFTMDAAAYGSNSDKWLDTGLDLVKGEAMTVLASGNVDLWPQTPGQYMSEASGLANTVGRGSQFLAGALIGKVGEGTPFLIGQKGEFTAAGGRLKLQIVPNPWNSGSIGGYSVDVVARRK